VFVFCVYFGCFLWLGNFSENKQTPGVFIHFIDLIITEETRT